MLGLCFGAHLVAIVAVPSSHKQNGVVENSKKLDKYARIAEESNGMENGLMTDSRKSPRLQKDTRYHLNYI